MFVKLRFVFLSYFVAFGTTFVYTKKQAKFVTETAVEQTDVNSYKKIGTSSYFGLIGQNSKAKCAIVCLHVDNCRSVYVEDGACVFGVSGDVTAFDDDGNSEETTPPEGQLVKVKCKYLLRS